MLTNRVPYQVLQIETLALHVTKILLRIAPDQESISYQAGQYITVKHQDENESPFSIACAPTDVSLIELHVSHPPKNHSAASILRMAKRDGELYLSGPFGFCTQERLFPEDEKNPPTLFLARGTGFAPVKSFLEALVMRKNNPPLHLYWSVTASEDYYLLDQLTAWTTQFSHFRFTNVLCKTDDQHKLFHNVAADYPDLSDYQIYASGPAKMVFAARDALLKHRANIETFYSDMTPSPLFRAGVIV